MINLLVINDGGINGGGTETRVKLLCNEMLDNNYAETIHIVQFGNKIDLNTDSRLIVHSLDNPKNSYSLIKEIIRQNKIDLVQAHNLLAINSICLKAAKEAKIPIVWYAHDYWPICAKRSFIDPYESKNKKLCKKTAFFKCLKCSGIKNILRLKILQYYLNKYTDIAVAACEFIKNKYVSHNILPNKWHIVAPWIDLNSFTDSQPQQRNKTIVFTGSLLEYKGAWILAEAFSFVLKKIPDAKLLFIGTEQEKDNLYRKKIDEILIKQNTALQVEFAGKKLPKELKVIYQGCGVYVCPTVCMESFGLNWAEAMSLGCPVIASNIGSIPELIKDKGVLIPPRDPQALADAIINILNNKNLASKLSSEGALYAFNNFSPKRAAEKIMLLYSSLLKN